MKTVIKLAFLLFLSFFTHGTSRAQLDLRHDLLVVPMQEISTSEAIEILKALRTETDSTMIDFGKRLAVFSWHRAMKEDTTDLYGLSRKIYNFGEYHGEFQLVVDIFCDVLDTATNFKLSDRLLANKYLAVALNKQGKFKASVEVLNKGLEVALKLNDLVQIRDHYHHLTYEYRYLSLIDVNLVDEYQRLNNKCIEYNTKLGLPESAYPNFIQKMVPKWSLSECRKNLDSILVQIDDHGAYYGRRFTILEEYILAVYLNGYYRECISILKRFYQEFPNDVSAFNASLASDAYLRLSIKDSAEFHAQRALQKYFNSKDQDDHRFALCFLPNVMYQLGDYHHARLLEMERYYFLKKQFINEPIQFIEQKRLHDELTGVRESHEHDKATNQFLILLILSSCTVVPIFLFSDFQIRKRNHIINRNVQKLSNSNIILSNANNDLESYAYASAHDIRSPLRSIGTILDFVQQDESNKISSQSQSYIQNINNQIDRVDKYINAILEYAQINRKTLAIESEVDAEQILRNLESKLNKEFQIAHPMIFRTGSLPLVTADPVLLETLLYNLLSNAIKFQPQEKAAAIHVIASTNKNKLKLEIVDDGIGIPEDEIRYVFNLFYRGTNSQDYPGAGVGLASSHKIAQLNKMKLSVANNIGKGITVTLTLPLS